ncbi:Met-10+ domain containing protein [Plasmodium gonderi]|uniref:tRNA (guanine(37)-N1)-methyltransferase n=1 Tax=Plasmodium gonderi TaxID=77519 RepID=A0A1Y1JG74_PLAGO|nr:Met-10+ domain containing protein [Plasmodium gonderi]GAW80207.1 Met-10+ domain containing protein [Plasmodium gonderi]
MFIRILYFLWILQHFAYVASLRKKGNFLHAFVKMNNPVNIKNLRDVKEKVKYEKKTHCLVLKKSKTNTILKNKYTKCWLMNVFKFPSVLKFVEYQKALIDSGVYNKELMSLIHTYLEKLEVGTRSMKNHASGLTHDQTIDMVKCETADVLKCETDDMVKYATIGQIGDHATDAVINAAGIDEGELRLIPLNEHFNKTLHELMEREGKGIMNGIDISPDEGEFQSDEEKKESASLRRERKYWNLINNEENNIKKEKYQMLKDVNKWPEDSILNDSSNRMKYLTELFYLIKKEDIKLSVIRLEFGYDNMNTSEILKKIFPSGNEIIHKYEMIGHIAHLNFCEKFEDYKKVIAEIILDKNKSIKTVINKKEMLNNVHRTFNMELLAGEKNYLTMLKENDIKIKLNYELIYWNSKLKKERDRIYDLVKKNSIIIDMFGGVGIFSLHLSKKNCLCFSNDINEHAYNYMNINVKLNKRKNILTYNLDATAFIDMLILLNLFSNDASTLTIHLNEQNIKNISLDFINSVHEQTNDNIKKKKSATTGTSNKTPDLVSEKKDAYHDVLDKKIKITSGDTNKFADEQDNNRYICHKDGLEPIHDVQKISQNSLSPQEERASCQLFIKDDAEKAINGELKNDLHKVEINLKHYGDIHVLMNLPQTAFKFLDVFRKIKNIYSVHKTDTQDKYVKDKMRNVFIHCYYFSKPEFFYEDAERNIRLQLKGIPREMKITEIRKVSPSKLMYVVEFNLKDIVGTE